ncbi:MAG: sodium:proton antiporter NhaD [Alphaproteobacteria bacterium]
MTNSIHAGNDWAGIFCLGIFALSYFFVLLEEKIHLRKSKPVMLGAAIIWIVIAFIAPQYGVDHHSVREVIFHGLVEYASLFLFLLVAMTYISALEDRNVFGVLRAKLVQSGMNFRQLFWVTGFLAFFISPVADNLTTALVMGTVVMAVGAGNPGFIALACINIVSAANAGGAFSPFGDITTLMVWQAQKVEFFEFFALFVPSLVNFIVPAFVMSFFVGKDKPAPLTENITMKKGALTVLGLGVLTIAAAVGLEQFLGLPPFFGMMAGLSVLMVAAWIIDFYDGDGLDFDVFAHIAKIEWDTLLFFFGIIFSVSGIAYLGYLEVASDALYGGLGVDATNILIGLFSAILDNIPLMFAVLQMNPEMDHFEWLLITLTTGVGGTLLSIGSAAGVALMGLARGQYTFFSHLKWFPVLLLGYAAAIAAHYLLN